ncbi:MAG: hypothetical protein WEB93_04100 [Sphingomonadales bacterium]
MQKKPIEQPAIPALPAHTREQIAELSLSRDRPLLISDADEVLVHFANPLEAFLDSRNMYLDLVDYRLVGNIRHRATDRQVERDAVFTLIDDFFEDMVDAMPLVDGALDALHSLSTRADVVVLTNVPNTFRVRRLTSFRRMGLDFPVISNAGLKGVPVQVLSEMTTGPVMFVDDIDRHISAVAELVPDSYRVHFVADPRLAAVCERAEHSHHRSDCWRQTRHAITTFLDDGGR